MILHKAQAEILSDDHRFRIVNCGRRFGKTTLAVEEIKCVAVAKVARIAYIAPTYQQARDIAWQMMVRELKGIVKKINESRLEIEVVNRNGDTSIIQLRGWESIETLRGQSFDFIVIDEVASMRNFWMNWHEVIRPTLTDRKGQVIFISTPKGFNHFYDLFNISDEDYRSFHFTSYDNPFIPKEEIDKAAQEIPEDRFAQEYMADFRKMEGLVYKEFDRKRHVTKDEPTTVTDTVAGIDWGYKNPASSHRIRIDGDRHYWIDDEFYKSEQTTDQIIEAVRLKKPTKVYPDPAEPDRIDMARRAGLNVREVSKDIEAGIDTVRELLKQGRIHIRQSCVNLINEFETYRYPEKKPDQNEKETPIKENDHALDEIRYVLHNIEPNPENVSIDPYFSEVGTYYKA
jgi:PBSX family phage terminase large subunit